MGGFNLGWQTEANKQAQERDIAQQQRTQKQNSVGAQLLDAINQSSNIKPTTKDDQGNIIPNPAYGQAQKDRRDLLTQYSALNSPEQHASFADRLHGLIFGHPTPHTQQPALSPNSSPNEPPQPVAAVPRQQLRSSTCSRSIQWLRFPPTILRTRLRRASRRLRGNQESRGSICASSCSSSTAKHGYDCEVLS